MDEYFIGLVREYRAGKIIFECNNHGFILQGVNLHMLALNQSLKLYIYFYQRLPISEYFAFLNLETKQYFLKLISINYVGPKIALKLLNYFTLEEFKEIISSKNNQSLQRIQGITYQLAIAIINHFQ